ncbi:MAG: O-antigen ligase family protein [Burkholderiales bacterium]|nr:O-antigen ligase family protein [Burkholderiales bacterium]
MPILLVPVAAYLLLIPQLAVTLQPIGGHDLARAAQMLLGLACVLGLTRQPREAALRLCGHAFVVPGAALTLLAVASVWHAAVPTMAARELALFVGLAGVAASVARQADVRDLPCTLVAAASALYVALVLLVYTLSFMGGQGIDRSELFIGYDNYRFYNHVQTVALPLCVLAATVLPNSGLARRLAWIASAGGLALLLAVAGRATLLGIALAALLTATLYGRAAARLLLNLLRALLLGLILFVSFFVLLPWLAGVPPTFSEAYYGSRLGSVDARLYLWQLALAQIGEAPWLGVGPMHYAHFPNPEAAHPHNVYLQVAAEWGVPALLVLLSLAAMALTQLHRAIRRSQEGPTRDVGMGLMLTSLAVAVDGLFSGNFVMPVSQVWIAFAFGWAWAWWRAQTASTTLAQVGPWPSRALLGAMLLSQVWLLWSAWPELLALQEHLRQARERVPNGWTNPRFWSHGWF